MQVFLFYLRQKQFSCQNLTTSLRLLKNRGIPSRERNSYTPLAIIAVWLMQTKHFFHHSDGSRVIFRTGATGAWHPWYFEFLCNGTREFFRHLGLTVAWHPWNFETFNMWHPWIEISKEGPGKENSVLRNSDRVNWKI